jgi:hypothetical protein
LSGNSDGSAAVGDTRGEGIDVGSFVTTSETLIVVGAIDGDVLLVLLLQFGNALVNSFHSRTRLSGFNSRDVGMAASTVPITLKWLGMQGNLNAEFLSNSLKEITGHPEMIAHFDANARADLEFPLRGHDFGVDTAYLDASVQTRLVMGFDDITRVDFAGSDTTVVWALRSRETADGPAVWFPKGIEKGVFLLETEPRLVVGVFFHQLGTFGTVVELVGCAVRVVAFAEDENVIAPSEGISVQGDGLEVDI